MSASKKQIAANRQNAQKSTGPKTDSGKAAVAQNALKYGLHSRHVTINAPRLKEDPAEFEFLLEQLCLELKPQTLFQKYLVNKIAACLWRSQRAVIAETAQINDQIRDIDSDFETNRLIMRFLDSNHKDPDVSPEDRENFFANQVGRRSLPKNSRDILFYEMRLDHQITRAYRLLQFLQSRRHPLENSDTIPEQPLSESRESSVPSFIDPPPAISGEAENQKFKNAKTKPISSNQKE